MHLYLVWAFHRVRGEGDYRSEQTGTVCVGFPKHVLDRLPCEGHREGLESFPEEMVCKPESKSLAGVSQQRLGLREAGIMESNVQSQRW